MILGVWLGQNWTHSCAEIILNFNFRFLIGHQRPGKVWSCLSMKLTHFCVKDPPRQSVKISDPLWTHSCTERANKMTNSCLVGFFLLFKYLVVSKIVVTYFEKKNVLVIKNNFWNSRLKAENLQNFWDHYIFILTVKGQYNFWNRILFNLFLEVSQIW